jgi:hypothetical protein
VTEAAATAVDVEDLRVETQDPVTGDGDRRERLVDLDGPVLSDVRTRVGVATVAGLALSSVLWAFVMVIRASRSGRSRGAWRMSPRAAGTRPRYASNVVVVYARVSSADQRDDLDRQVARLSAWTGGQGIPVGCVVTEVGSALNGERGQFLTLLRDPDVTTIVVGHRDWFARFGEPPQLLVLGASVSFLTFQSPRSVIGAGQCCLAAEGRCAGGKRLAAGPSAFVWFEGSWARLVGALVPDDAEAPRWR